MEQYILQLIEDILAAQRPEEEKIPYGEDDGDIGSIDGVTGGLFDEDDKMERHFAEVERYLSGEGEQKIADMCGLYNEQFPPADRLNKSQMKRVAEAYEQMLFSYNIYAELPKKLPVQIKYEVLRNTLERNVYVPLNDADGMTGLNLCESDVETCPFGEKFCDCKYYLEEYKNDEQTMANFDPNNDELPF